MPDTLTAYSTLALAGVTLLLAVIAVFQDRIRGLFWCPRLLVGTTGKPPDCHMLKAKQESPKGIESVDCCYLRIRVRNAGHVTAQQVEVYVAEIQQRQPNRSYKTLQDHPSNKLVWSYSDPRISTLSSLHPGIELYCDLGHIVNPRQKYPRQLDPNETELDLDVAWRSTSPEQHTLSRGEYRLHLLVAAANIKPVKRVLELDLTGPWYDDEDTMLSKGVTIRLL